MSEEMICPKENINRVKNNSGGMHSFTENDIKNNTRSSELCDKKIVGKSDLFNSMDIDHFDIIFRTNNLIYFCIKTKFKFI